MAVRIGLYSFFAFIIAANVAATQQGLQIVIISGEDGVNIIQQKTAVRPLIEVRDTNNIPVAGVLVVFAISAGGRNAPAAFENGASRIEVTTDGAGRAAPSAFEPTASGEFSIEVTASLNGETVMKSIKQSNYETTEDARAAGKTPTSAATGLQNADGEQTEPEQSEQGAQASGVSSNGSRAASGGMSNTTGAVLLGTVIGTGAVVAAVVAANLPPDCSSEEDAARTAADAVVRANQCFRTANTTAQLNACIAQLDRAAPPASSAMGAWCTCLGDNATDKDVASVRSVRRTLNDIGVINFGALGTCYNF